MSHTRSVVIVGAGIAGVSLAYELSKRAGITVTVVERADAVAQGVTSLGSGGFRQQFGTREECLLSVRTLELWDRLQTDEGTDLRLHHNGYLILGSTPAAAANIVADAELQRSLGIDVELLDRHGLTASLPGVLVDDVDVATITRRDGYGSPQFIAGILRDLALAHGARFLFGRSVDDVVATNGSVSGVVVDGELIAADVVVNAAGLDAPQLGSMVGLDLPVAAWRQHQYETVPLDGLSPEAFPCFFDPAHDLYFRPLEASVLVGYAEAADAPRRDYEPSRAVGDNAHIQLAKRWPEASTKAFVREWVGCYEVTPDRRALVGEHPDLSGYFYSAGFSGHGLMNSLATAEGLADLIEGNRPSNVDLAVFAADRFTLEGAPTAASGRTDTSW